MMDWAVGTGCALHDASKALQWALAPWVTDKQMVKDLYVVIESCRNGFDLLTEYMPVFLVQHMVRSPAAYSKEAVAAWWRCMGVSADWVEHLADLNPIFRQGKLVVSEKIGGQVVSADLVADCLLYIFKFSKFSETRWCGVGQSCRALVSSLSVGLYPLAILALKLKGSKETKLHGVKKLSDDIKWYAAVASIVTFVPEAFCVAVAEDDRVCRRLGELEAIVMEEAEYLFRIERFVWQRLAHVAKGLVIEAELKNACLQGCHVSVSFLAHRVFSVARALPWSLTLGDVDANLTELQGEEGPAVTDPVSKKILRLLELGR